MPIVPITVAIRRASNDVIDAQRGLESLFPVALQKAEKALVNFARQDGDAAIEEAVRLVLKRKVDRR